MMQVATAPDRPIKIAGMKERHHEIKRRLIAGDRYVDIARDMGMTQSWLSIVVSSPVFQMELQKLRAEADREAADISKRLTNLSPDAMTVLERAIRGKNGDFKPPDGISAAKQADIALTVLERDGHGKPQQTTPSTANVKVEIVQFNVPAGAAAETSVKATVIEGEVAK